MIGWSVVIVGTVIVAVGLLALRDGRQRLGERQAMPPAPAAPPDFTRDREVARLTHMRAEDRDWEAASLQRQRVRDAARDPATEALRSD